MGIFKRHRSVFKAMAKVAIDDRIPEGAAPDLTSVKAVMMANGLTDDAAAAAASAACVVVNIQSFYCVIIG